MSKYIMLNIVRYFKVYFEAFLINELRNIVIIYYECIKYVYLLNSVTNNY